MTKQQYERWSSPFRNMKAGARIISAVDHAITLFTFFAYPCLLAYLLLKSRMIDLFICTFLPAVSFFAVSLFRNIYSAPRPYEIMDIHPLIEKKTKGKSFPSRHVFSIFMIGMTFFYIARPAGILICALGILLSYLRVAGGVHFPKDVVAGALIGILCGMLYWLLPLLR